MSTKKYATEEERRAAQKLSARKWYETHKEQVRVRKKDYYQTHKVQQKLWYEQNKDHANATSHKYKLRKQYNMTPEDYEVLLQQQSGVCAICGATNPNGSRLGVDHDHETGKVRGLLCSTCNVALGKLEKDRTWAEKAITYLIQADQTPVLAAPVIAQSP